MVRTNDGSSQVPLCASIIWFWWLALLFISSNVTASEELNIDSRQVITNTDAAQDASLSIEFSENDNENMFPGGDYDSIEEEKIMALPFDFTDAPKCDPSFQKNKNNKHGGDVSHRYDPLACWLWKLQVVVPDQKIKKGVFSASIKGMICTNFAIGSIQSSYISSSSKKNDKDPSILLGVSGISAVCKGKYKSTGMSGTVRAIVKSTDTAHDNSDSKYATNGISKPSSPLELDLIFVSGFWKNKNNPQTPPIRMATSVKTNSCNANLQVPEHGGIHFSGSASAKFIDLFSKPIAKYVSSALSSQLCPIIKSGLDPALSKIIKEADDYMTNLILHNKGQSEVKQPIIGEGPTRSVVDRILTLSTGVQVLSDVSDAKAENDPVMDFSNDAPLLNAGLEIGNKILHRYLDKGILLDLLGEVGGEQQGDKTKELIFGEETCTNCGYFFRGFNGVVRSLTNGTGAFGFDIPKPLRKLSNITFVVPKYAKASILIKHIYASGLDKLSSIDLLRPSPSDNNSFVSSVGSNAGFNISIAVDIEVTSVPGGMFQGDPLKESFHVELNSSAAHLLNEMMFGINRDQFADVNVGDAISAVSDAIGGDFTSILCLISPLKVANISDLMADIDLLGISFVPDIIQSTSKGDSVGQLEKDIDKMINNFLQLFIGEYSLLVTETMKGASKGPVATFLNREIAKLLQSISTDEVKIKNKRDCPEKHGSNPKEPNYVNFQKITFLKKMNRFLNSASALRPINRYIRCIEGYANQMLPLASNLSIGGVTMSLQDIHIHNLGSLNELEIMNPDIDGFHLHNSIGFANCGEYDHIGTCEIPRISFGVEMHYPKFNVSGTAHILASLGNFSTTGGGKIYFDMNKFRSLSLSKLLARAQCMGTPASILDMYDVSATLGIVDLNVNASLNVASFDPVEINFQAGEKESLASFASSAISWSLESLEEFFNQISILVLPKMSDLCEGRSIAPTQTNREQENDSSTMLLWNAIFFGVAILVAQVSIVLSLRWGRSSSEYSTRTPRRDSSEQFAPSNDDFYPGQIMEPLLPNNENRTLETPEEDEALKTKSAALMLHGGIPTFVRHGLAIITMGTVLLLLSSNLSVGASVNARVTVPDSKSIALPSLFAFSLGNTIREFYNAGIFALLFLVLVFSGVWPYVKLFMMLFAWMAPERILSQGRREHCLLTLDSLSKFSLVDAYVLVLMLVAFRFHLDLEEAVVIDVFVTPGYGFYGFLLATTMSLAIGETMLYYHRRVAGKMSSCGSKESICQHKFVNMNGQTRTMSRSFQIFIIILALSTLVLLAIGVTRESFKFEFGGLAGILLGDERSKSYSVVSLGYSLPASVEDPTSLGISFIQAAYFFYAIVTPFTCIAIVLLLFLYPMTLKVQCSFVAIAEIANAWSAIEVFVLSVIAALFEISTFAQFIIGDKCDIIDDILSKHFDQQMNGDDTCYNVKATVGWNSCYLIIGVILNSFLVSTLLRFIHCATAERTSRESSNGELRSDTTHEQNLVDFLIRWKLQKFVFAEVITTPEDNSGGILREAPTPSRLWEEWRKICSWT